MWNQRIYIEISVEIDLYNSCIKLWYNVSIAKIWYISDEIRRYNRSIDENDFKLCYKSSNTITNLFERELMLKRNYRIVK